MQLHHVDQWHILPVSTTSHYYHRMNVISFRYFWCTCSPVSSLNP